jgi:undecaprenyl diphosphate synthase
MNEKNLPKHVAFIMDGNGRWAKKRGKSRSVGHRAGYKALDTLISYAFDRGIEVLSFYAFSTENWSRPEEEVSKLMALMARALKASAPKLCRNKVRFMISCDYSMVKPKVKQDIDELIAKTANFEGKTLNICFNYGSRAEIVRAFNLMISDGVKEVDEQTVSKYLWTASIPDPDLVVRTSGEQRLSNFLLWQSCYSELYFTDVLWPDFSPEEFEKALDWFASRERRFGKC